MKEFSEDKNCLSVLNKVFFPYMEVNVMKLGICKMHSSLLSQLCIFYWKFHDYIDSEDTQLFHGSPFLKCKHQ